jgi:hypothetical protein
VGIVETNAFGELFSVGRQFVGACDPAAVKTFFFGNETRAFPVRDRFLIVRIFGF